MREPEGVKLFIGQVPKDYKESDLRSLFEVYGDIHSLNLLADKSTGQHKGCAFLTYFDNASSTRAQEELHEKRTLPGARNPIQVKPAASEINDDNRKLFIGMLSRELDEDKLKDMFSSFGSIKNLTILRDPQKKSKGCAFILFETRLQAQNAMKSMHNSLTMEGCSKPIVVKLADTEKDKIGKKLLHGNSPAVGGVSTPTVLPGLTGQLLQQQSAYYQQLLAQLALPQLLASNPALAAAAINNPGALSVASAKGDPYNSVNNPASNNTYSNQLGALPLATNTYPGIQQYYSSLPQTSYSLLQQGTVPASSTSESKKEGPNGANLFIYQIPTEYTDADLVQTFLPFGNVLSAKVFIDKKNQMSKGFGFVSYDSPSSATAAINAMNGFVIGSKRLKVQLKKPKDQGKPY